MNIDGIIELNRVVNFLEQRETILKIKVEETSKNPKDDERNLLYRGRLQEVLDMKRHFEIL